MANVINRQETVNIVPSGYTGQTNISSENTTYPWSRGYNGSDHTENYARIQLSATSTSTDCYIYYTFNTSEIPAQATIDSVTCSARISRNNRVGSSTIQLYSGTTAKGSSASFSSTQTTGTSVTVTNISNAGTWTLSELQNARLRITGRRSSTNQTGYIYFFGATLTITYTLDYTQYEITSLLTTDEIDSISPEGVTTMEDPNDDYVLNIYGASIDNIKVEDNGSDVTEDLVRHELTSTGEITAVPSTTFTTHIDGSGGQFYVQSSETGTRILELAIGYSAESPNPSLPTGTSVGNYNYVKDNNNNTATGYIEYNFDFSEIPEGSTINSVSVKVYGCRETSTTDSTHVAKVELYSGTTQKGASQELTSTSNSIHIINNVGTWTRAELQNAKLRFTVAYYGGRVGGISWYVDYTPPSNNPYYWTYTLSNINADHTITVGDKIIEIPEEDPVYEYYPITISSVNATTNPRKGTVRLVEGSNQTIEIYPTDPLVTLITDNGVDVSNQLVAHGGTISDPTVSTASGASYGFTLNQSTGYYVSNNTGVDKSAAVCRVDFNLPVRCLVTIQYINYAEATYDFGVFGNIDVALSNNYYAAGSGGATITDASYKFACNASSANTSTAQTLTYEIESGEHFINIKYSKDDATANNNDSLQWKILSIEPLESNNYYTYTLTNIQQAHSLIFIFGDVTYYMINGGGSGCKLFPSGSLVYLPGDNYQLTIVPNDYAWSVTVTDNNVNVTSSVQKVEQEMTKDGETYTVVNYIYNITNVQANHTISASCVSTSNNYIKVDDRWTRVEHIFKKVNNVWVEQINNLENALTESGNIYFYHN